MGLLDDAIREHLDLKRRRGADPSEIAKEEADALGPVRRDEPEEPVDDAADHGSYADHDPAGLDEPAVVYDDEPDFDRPQRSEPPTTHDHIWAEPEEESATPPHGDPLAHQQTREFSATELGDALGHDSGAAAPAPAPEAPATPSPAAAPEDVVPGDEDEDDDGAPDAEDELEETPDFLQETPEHDRLWFEQKPPKDFDF